MGVRAATILPVAVVVLAVQAGSPVVTVLAVAVAAVLALSYR